MPKSGLCNKYPEDCTRMEKIIEAVAHEYDIKASDIKGKRRDTEFAFPRQIAAWFSRTFVEASLQHIALHLGNRDHTTIMYAISRIGQHRPAETLPEYADIVAAITPVAPTGPFDRGQTVIWTRFSRPVRILTTANGYATISYTNACGQWTVADRLLREFSPLSTQSA